MSAMHHVTLKGELWLKPEHFNSAGNNPYDGAASLSNIRDTCYGNQVGTQICQNVSRNFLEGKKIFIWCRPWGLCVLEGVDAGGNVWVCDALSRADWSGHPGESRWHSFERHPWFPTWPVARSMQLLISQFNAIPDFPGQCNRWFHRSMQSLGLSTLQTPGTTRYNLWLLSNSSNTEMIPGLWLYVS